jgi:hypothetical protein
MRSWNNIYAFEILCPIHVGKIVIRAAIIIVTGAITVARANANNIITPLCRYDPQYIFRLRDCNVRVAASHKAL